MQVHMRLDGKPAGPQIVQVKPSSWMNGTFNIFARLLNVDAAVSYKLFERAECVLFLILRLDLNGRPILQRH